MTMSSWYVSDDGLLVCEGSSAKLKILHLEDHSIFHVGMRKCIDKFITDAEYMHFGDGLAALEYYKEIMKTNERPDIIITDINHPGMRGDDFVRAVREAEQDCGVRTPIMILSMVDPSRYMELVNEMLVDHCLQKSASGEDILEGIKRLLSL